MKKYYLACLALLISGKSAGNSVTKTSYLDKLLHQFAQTWLVTEFNSLLSEDPEKNRTKEACRELQELGRLAQESVGIPTEQIVPILETTSNDNFFAQALPYGIIVNQKYQEPYAVNRCNMYHEAVHVKYKDSSVASIFNLGACALGLSLGLFTTKKFRPRGFLKLLYPIAMLSAASLSKRLVSDFYKKYYERRADREGHYAVACSLCVKEKADDIAGYLETLECIYDTKDKRITSLEEQVQKGDLEISEAEQLKSAILNIPVQIQEKNKYYLSAQENRKIAAILEQENKICDFHRRNKK